MALLRALMTTVTPMALEHLWGFFVGFFCMTTRLVCESIVLPCGVISVCVEPVSLEATTFTKDCTLLNCYKLTTAAKNKRVPHCITQTASVCVRNGLKYICA